MGSTTRAGCRRGIDFEADDALRGLGVISVADFTIAQGRNRQARAAATMSPRTKPTRRPACVLLVIRVGMVEMAGGPLALTVTSAGTMRRVDR